MQSKSAITVLLSARFPAYFSSSPFHFLPVNLVLRLCAFYTTNFFFYYTTSFGAAAIDNFLENNELSYIIRAHEAHAHGVSLSKGARWVLVIIDSLITKYSAQWGIGCNTIWYDGIGDELLCLLTAPCFVIQLHCVLTHFIVLWHHQGHNVV